MHRYLKFTSARSLSLSCAPKDIFIFAPTQILWPMDVPPSTDTGRPQRQPRGSSEEHPSHVSKESRGRERFRSKCSSDSWPKSVDLRPIEEVALNGLRGIVQIAAAIYRTSTLQWLQAENNVRVNGRCPRDPSAPTGHWHRNQQAWVSGRSPHLRPSAYLDKCLDRQRT